MRAHWVRVRVIYYKPKEFFNYEQILTSFFDMRSDIEVMLAKKFSFNRIACLSLHMYATDAKIETNAVWKNDFIGQRRQITDTEKHYPSQEQVLT